MAKTRAKKKSTNKSNEDRSQERRALKFEP